MENLIVKKYINKKEQTILVTFNEEGKIDNNNDEAAITLYSKDKEIAHIYVNNGVIENHNDNPAIFFKEGQKEFTIRAEYGFIHSKDIPAINYEENENNYKYYFHCGAIENINGAAIIKENSKCLIEMFAKNNKSTTGYNCKISVAEQLKTKAQVCFNIESFLSLKIDENHVTELFDKIELYVAALNLQSENYTYPKKENDLPHIIGFSEDLLIEKLMWLNHKGLHRKGKPALIQFLKQSKIKFYYYEDGEGKEDLFRPHTFIKNRSGGMKVLDFEFLDEDVQSYYSINNLTPFFMSIEERDRITEAF